MSIASSINPAPSNRILNPAKRINAPFNTRSKLRNFPARGEARQKRQRRGGIKAKKIIAEKGLNPDILNGAADWPKKTINEVLPLLLSFNFGNNKIQQMISFLNEISKRENIAIDSILKDCEWEKIQHNKDIPDIQKGSYLRNILFAKRYPVYTELKDKIKHAIARLKLPKNITITPDIFTLENDFIGFKIQCGESEELKKSAQKLAEIADSKELQELLELLKI